MESRVTYGELALREDIPNLETVKNAFGIATLKEWLSIQFNDFLDYNETTRGSSDYAIEESCVLIINTYWYLNVLEIHKFFADCKLSKFGKFYGTSGPASVCRWLRDYVSIRQADIDHIQREEDMKRREELSSSNLHSQYKEYLETRKKAESGDKEAQMMLMPPELRGKMSYEKYKEKYMTKKTDKL